MFWNLCIYTRVIFNLIHFVYVLHIFTILISEWNVNSKHCILNISPNARRERGEESSWTLQTKPNLIHLRFSWCKHYRSPPLNLNKIPKIVSAIIWEYFPRTWRNQGASHVWSFLCLSQTFWFGCLV